MNWLVMVLCFTKNDTYHTEKHMWITLANDNLILGNYCAPKTSKAVYFDRVILPLNFLMTRDVVSYASYIPLSLSYTIFG